MNCTYLGHSTFLLETEELRLLFDPTEVPAIAQNEKPLLILSSHRHSDHWNKEIFSLAQKHRVTFILSDDISSSDVPKGIAPVWVKPHQSYTVAGIEIETLRSTDEGVAFLLRLKGTVIYYAGDLNWWHWEGESSAYNSAMAEAYKKEMQRLPKVIDIAFVPVDPRLGPYYKNGVEGLLDSRVVKRVVPMHMWGEYSVIGRLQEDLSEIASAIVTLEAAPFTWRIG